MAGGSNGDAGNFRYAENLQNAKAIKKRKKPKKIKHVCLVQNVCLDSLAMFLSEEKPDFDSITEKYLDRMEMKKEYPLHHHLQAFRQIFVEDSIEKAMVLHPSWRVSLMDVPGTDRYHWDFDALGKARVYSRTKREYKLLRDRTPGVYCYKSAPLFSYEHLVYAAGIPTIIEYCRIPRLEFRRNKVSLLSKMLGGRDCGYIMLAHRENLSNHNERYFIHRGGYLALLDFSDEDFKKEAEKKVKGMNLEQY